MQLLDASLAFALTMAALATVVTVIMEAGLRVARMRKKNFIEVMKLLNKEIENSPLKMSEEDRWNFIKRVIDNPAEASLDKLSAELGNLSVAGRLAYFGRDKAAGKNFLQRVGRFLLQIFGDRKRAGLFDRVSLEYMLRCLAESEAVKKASSQAISTIRAEFNRFARKYEEFSSSVSASYKQHAQQWSVIVGILLAFAGNIDGLRIFENYRTDPELAAAIIQKHEAFLEENQSVQDSFEALNDLYIQARVIDRQIQEAKDNRDNDLGQLKEEKKEIEAMIEKQSDIREVQETLQSAKRQLDNLANMGVPIGWEFYPNYPYSKSGTDEKWEAAGAKYKDIAQQKLQANSIFKRVWLTVRIDPSGFAFWMMSVAFTGVLIGLGAPFWFDIAKRLAQVRKGLQNIDASAEFRFSARDANGDPKMRREIVDTVLADAQETANSRTAASVNGKPGPQLGPKAIRL